MADNSTGFNLDDPNSIVSAGQQVSNTTGPAYSPLITDPASQTNLQQQNATNPQLSAQDTFQYTPIGEYNEDNELRNPGQISPDYYQTGTDTATASQVTAPQNTGPSSYDATHAQAATQNWLLNGSTYNSTGTQAVKGQLAQGSTYDAYQGQVDPQSMVQNQLQQILTTGIPEGQTVPDWARPAVTAARQAMNDMGLGNSTMAGNATADAILKTALPIAAQNAQVVAQLNSQNTAAINAARQYNASTVAQLNLLNTQNAQTAANLTAQAANDASKFDASVVSQLMFTNLANQQQTLLSNQAADNAAKQFNAQSAQQNNQFFASLTSQIAAQNADRSTAVSQFNAGQQNSMSQFLDNLGSQREEFNSQNQLLVEQSNVQWRRAVNTANTAGTNAAAQANVQNLFNLTQTAQNNLWQQARDEASWALTSTENAKNRELSLVNSSLNRQTSLQILASQLNAQMFGQLGQLAGNILGGPIGNGLANSLFGGNSDNSSADFGGGGDLASSVNDFGGGGDFSLG